MDSRKHPLAECQSCPWREIGHFVPSQFPDGPARIAVVGEAPGLQEARTGVPFTGPSGELLDAVAGHHGLARTDLALINVAACRPKGPTEKPPKKAIESCRPRLEHDLKKANAPQILALGGTAAQTLLDSKTKITKLRIGPARNSKYGPVISTWHPAFCLRTPDAFPDFVKDVGKLNGTNYGQWKPPNYKVFNDPVVALQAINRLKTMPLIVIDIEIATDKDLDDSHPEDYDLLCVGVAYADQQAVVFGSKVFDSAECVAAFSDLLSSVRVVGHNAKFDILGLSPIVGLHKLYADTMLMSYTLDERPRQHGLKKLAVERLGAPKYDEEIAVYGKNFALIPKPLLYKYNAYDVACTWDLYKLFSLEMLDYQKKNHDFMIEAINELIVHMELAGFTFDEEYNDQLLVDYEEKLAQSEKAIQEHVGFKLNPRSPIQLLRYFGEQGYSLPTTGKDFLELIRPNLKPNVAEFVDLLLINRRISKLYGTYIKGLRKKVKNGKVHTTISLHGSTSGRTASRNPNMQNIITNRDIRNQFTATSASKPDLPPEKRRILIQADYSQIEARVIAFLAKEEYLRELFWNPDVDIFDDMCNKIFGPGNWDKMARRKIKSVHYGTAYGREAKSIANVLDISVVEASDLIKDFRRLMPKTVEWQEDIKRRVLEGEDLITPFGRKRSFHLITNENQKDVLNEALSFYPQSIASDICIRAAVRLRPILEKMDATILLTIHDAIIAECYERDLEKVQAVMVEEMERSGRDFTDWVPFRVDVSSAYRLGDLK